MGIVGSAKIRFLVSNIFEKYYVPIQEELSCSGLEGDLAHNIIQEILKMIYQRAMSEEIETEEELDNIAMEIINEQLEQILFSYYAQEYIDRFSFVKETKENALKQEEQEFIESEIDNKIDNAENTEFDNAEKIGLENERKEPPIIRKMEEPRIRRFQMNWTLTILLSILLTLMLWFVVGILMGRGYLPRVDFGYTWFNSHIWSIF